MPRKGIDNNSVKLLLALSIYTAACDVNRRHFQIHLFSGRKG